MSDIDYRVWVGCLSCYNDGRLVGQWYDAEDAADVTTQELHTQEGIETDEQGYVKGEEIYGPHEELWCFDVEAPIPAWNRECSPMEATERMEKLSDIADELYNCPFDAFLMFVDNIHGELDTDTAQEAEERYCGEWSSFREYAEEDADEQIRCMSADAARGPFGFGVNETAQTRTFDFLVRYFDYDTYARELAFDYTTFDSSEGVYVFRDA